MISLVIMSLNFFTDDQFFEFLQNLILQINEHAELEEYAIVLLCTKKSKLKVTRKEWLICDRDKKTTEFHEQERCHDTEKK